MLRLLYVLFVLALIFGIYEAVQKLINRNKRYNVVIFNDEARTMFEWKSVKNLVATKGTVQFTIDDKLHIITNQNVIITEV